MIRGLRADEIELRVGTCSSKGFSLLLYKDARCDMNILDEVYPGKWQREHKELKGNIYCGVGIWSDELKEWMWKWDCGAESFTEAAKGEASDSFKRACVNVGIGRELYSAEFIWISGHTEKKEPKGYKTDGYERGMYVSEITYEETESQRTIKTLVIKDANHKVAYSFGKADVHTKQTTDKKETTGVDEKDRPKLVNEIGDLMESMNLSPKKVYAKIKIDNISQLDTQRMPGCIKWLNNLSDKEKGELKKDE